MAVASSTIPSTTANTAKVSTVISPKVETSIVENEVPSIESRKFYHFGNDWTGQHRASVIETKHDRSEHTNIENLVIKVYDMINEMSKKIEKIEECFEMIGRIEYVEKDVNNLNEMVIDLQNDKESNHDEFMQYIDEKFEKIVQTMAFMIKNTKKVEKNISETTTNDEESEGSSDENLENDEIEQNTKDEAIIEEGDTEIEQTTNYHKYLVEYINGEWSIEEYLNESKESDEIDLS